MRPDAANSRYQVISINFKRITLLTMPMYMIEVEVPGVGAVDEERMKDFASKSSKILESVASKVVWSHSYVSRDILFCVFHSENKDLLKEHADNEGFPLSKVSVVHATFDKTIMDSDSAYGPSSIGPVNASELSNDPRSKFMVIRPNPKGKSMLSHAELQSHAGSCRDACRKLGLQKVVWDHSFNTENGLYEMYFASNEEAVVEHTIAANFMVEKTARVTTFSAQPR